MSEQVDVDDFLEHVGVRGMKWGKRRSRSDRNVESNPKPKMSRQKKMAIAAGVGAAAVAVGLSVTLKVVNKNATLPISEIMDRPSVKRGQQTSTKAPPRNNSNGATSPGKPKTPSPYPMTPLIPTPILDEIIKKYKL